MFAENGMWLSLVERCVRDAKAAGSNPVIPTSINKNPLKFQRFNGFFVSRDIREIMNSQITKKTILIWIFYCLWTVPSFMNSHFSK